MNSERTVNPCQPGYNASCALCCGSHNYTLDRDQVRRIFSERRDNFGTFTPAHPEESVYDKLFSQEMQCQNMGELPGEPGIIGCLVYETDELTGDAGSFFTGTCKVFTCPACYSLNDEQILFAARLMGDWYYYSLLINFPETVEELFAEYGSAGAVPDEVLEELKEELMERFIEEDGK